MNLAYLPVEFLATVRHGFFKELDGPAAKIDTYDGELQRFHLRTVNSKLSPPPAAATTAIPFSVLEAGGCGDLGE